MASGGILGANGDGDYDKPKEEEFKLILGCLMNEAGEMQLHVNTTDETMLALMLRRLNQAVDVRMVQEANRQRSNIIQATSVVNRIKQ